MGGGETVVTGQLTAGLRGDTEWCEAVYTIIQCTLNV